MHLVNMEENFIGNYSEANLKPPFYYIKGD